MRNLVLAFLLFAGPIFGAVYLPAVGLLYGKDVLATIPSLPTAPSIKVAPAQTTSGYEAILTWSASTDTYTGGTISFYAVERGTVSGGPYTSLGTTTALTYADTTVAAGQTYYYVVNATDSLGNVSANSAQVSATVPGGTTTSAGSIYVLGGTTTSYTDPSGNVWTGQTQCTAGTNAVQVTHAIAKTTTPLLFQYEFYNSSFTCSFTGLAPSTSYNVTVNEAEEYWTKAGERVFSATVNGAALFTNLDLFKDSGGEYIADPKSGTFTSTASGTMVISMVASVDHAKFDSISIVPVSTTPPPPPPPTPTVSVTCTSGATGSGSSTCGVTTTNVPSGTAATVSVTTDGVTGSTTTTIP